ncbi:hypothetical protein AAEP93_005846, partial [Penicillium crustosum]
SERSQKGEIKRDVEKFEESFGIRQREEWLNDLAALFKGAPKKYISDSQKVLAATNYLCTSHKGKWQNHILNHPEDEANWKSFEEWTKTLLRNSYNIVTDILILYQQAEMRPNQDPRTFEHYLQSLEKHLPAQTEEQKAQALFMKLTKPLRDLIVTSTDGVLPATRTQMASKASMLYNVHLAHQKRKEHPTPGQEKQKKGNHTDSRTNQPQNHTFSSTNSNPRRGQARGRGQTRGRGRGGYSGRTHTSGV